MIQDIAPKRLLNPYDPTAKPAPESVALHFLGKRFLCRAEGGELTFPTVADLGGGAGEYTYLFKIDDTAYFLRRGDAELSADGFAYEDIALWRGSRPRENAFAAVTAFHLASWYAASQFCGRCGEKTVHDEKERMMRCPRCGNLIFPKIMPSVIVAVTHGDRLLLTRYANRPGASRFALVAGFTEIGETAEETVAREVMEEVGLRVKNIRYYKSQPWGISAGGLLLGYWCEVDGDDTIRLDHVELADGAWVTRDELRETYTDAGVALTGEMIEQFIRGNNP
ncbi:MAG: NAD(+) diphosphatase [Ruminococcaceae bacterium]|nr:NAD(+) diphosphatase [Oscillospiraceae bacterium]